MKGNKDETPTVADTSVAANEKETDDSAPSAGRRDAVTKLAYASPLVAGLLFSRQAAAFSPPPPPGP